MRFRNIGWGLLALGLVIGLTVSVEAVEDEAEKPASKPVAKKVEDTKPPAETEKPKIAAKKTAHVAHIKLSGGMEEKAPSADPLFGSLGAENFKAKIDRIHKAAKDKDIQALYLEIDGVTVGWGKLDELARAIHAFRATGKPTFAFIESGTAKDYLLGLQCGDLCMPESAWVMLVGIRAEVSFYKDLLAWLGITADMLQMGDFKAAAEPFTRNSMSKESREQLTSVLDDYYEKGIVERIAKARPKRRFTPEKVRELIDAGPYSAPDAKKAGLIDRLGYADAYPDVMKAALKADVVKIEKDYAKPKHKEMDIFSLYRELLLGPGRTTSSKGPKVAVIYATGAIMSGKSGSSLLGGETMGSETMVKAIRQAEEDKTVKAIVLRIDSPGGSALASDMIWNEVKRCKKPVIASMSDVAASGGYYISMSARKIYAEAGTLTGSIGVVGGKMALGGAYAKIGIKTEVISRGANAGILSTTEPFTKSEKATFKRLMATTYDQFLSKALEGRQKAGVRMTRDQLEKLAGGRIWTGRQAKANGLIDELGTLEDAIAAAWKMAGMPADKEPELLQLPKAHNFLESLAEKMGDLQAPGLDARTVTLRGVPGLMEKLRPIAAMLELRNEPVWLVMPYRIEVK